MPPRKRKSVPQPATEPEAKHQQISTLPDLPEAYRVIAEPVHQALSGLLEHLSDQKQPSLESVKDAAQAHLSQFFPTDKEVADSLLQSWVLNISSQSGEDLTPLFRSLDMTLACTQLGFCNETFVVVCLETLLESHSVQKASQLFAWVELRSTALTAGLDPRKAKALTLLRTFNELLRRLSKTNQTVFCGRILMFLAASFPLGDQSSVNLKGAFDTGNVTALHDPDWGQHPKEMDADGDQEQRDKTPEPTEPGKHTIQQGCEYPDSQGRLLHCILVASTHLCLSAKPSEARIPFPLHTSTSRPFQRKRSISRNKQQQISCRHNCNC